MPGLSNSRWAPRSSSVPSSTRLSIHPPPPLPRPGAVGPTASIFLSLPSSSSHTTSSYSAYSVQTTAATTTSGTTAQQRQHSAAEAGSTKTEAAANASAELSRCSRIVRRMKWKMPFLDEAYRQATSRPTNTAAAAAVNGEDAAAAEAELMFKLDFFEFYMLLERALVHLQLVFGIVISPRGQSNNRIPSPDRNGDVSAGKVGGHRYHANVLAALDSPDNPLHDTLGAPDVRRQLGRAKDLRNRWKNADTVGEGESEAAVTRNGKLAPPLPLERYDLATILPVIFEAFERGFCVAERYVGELCAAAAVETSGGDVGVSGRSWADELESAAVTGGNGGGSGGPVPLPPSEEQLWGFMVEAMDWEAI